MGFIVRSILGAVFFTILLVTANAMAQSVRERIPELAILKTLGFTDTRALALVLAEALMMCLLGGLLGLVFVTLILPGVARAVGNFLPGLAIDASTWGIGAALAIALGVITGLLPALRAQRLRIVDALSGH
jgi:putative ABC transport system permease protein